MHFVRFANASANVKLFVLQKSKQNNFRFAPLFTNLTKHVNINQTNCCIMYFGKNEENMDLSRIHLAVDKMYDYTLRSKNPATKVWVFSHSFHFLMSLNILQKRTKSVILNWSIVLCDQLDKAATNPKHKKCVALMLCFSFLFYNILLYICLINQKQSPVLLASISTLNCSNTS